MQRPRASRSLPLRPNPGFGSTFVSSLREWSLVAAFVWMLGLTLTALVGLRRWRETELMMASSEPAPEALRVQTADSAARLHLRRVPEVRMSSRIETPLVAGRPGPSSSYLPHASRA